MARGVSTRRRTPAGARPPSVTNSGHSGVQAHTSHTSRGGANTAVAIIMSATSVLPPAVGAEYSSHVGGG